LVPVLGLLEEQLFKSITLLRVGDDVWIEQGGNHGGLEEELAFALLVPGLDEVYGSVSFTKG
jgi:hypothetical protein